MRSGGGSTPIAAPPDGRRSLPLSVTTRLDESLDAARSQRSRTVREDFVRALLRDKKPER
ncbi:hypothetical protein [Streptomyces sp. NPDC050287]|uniref:hypothetical protein n=1 Tax=Streptomyces sp. NPDC050287 TaxID=3365608 RepID=UPI0037936866